MKTIIITVQTKEGDIMRDARSVQECGMLEALHMHLSRGSVVLGVEELDQTLEEIYTKTLSDDDIDAMAAQVPQ